MGGNLIISTIGDKSLHKEWLKDNPNFDTILLYYGDDEEKAKEFDKDAPCYMGKGFKWHLIKSFLLEKYEFIKRYDYVWFPDDDVRITTKEINKLFQIARENDLWLCQPAMKGYVSHEITKPQTNKDVRFTNFVEVLAPMMRYEKIWELIDTFDSNYSSWGYEVTWDFLLGKPKNKIAIIDSIVMEHTKPVGNPALYSKIPHSLEQDQQMTFNKFKITEFPPHQNYE